MAQDIAVVGVQVRHVLDGKGVRHLDAELLAIKHAYGQRLRAPKGPQADEGPIPSPNHLCIKFR